MRQWIRGVVALAVVGAAAGSGEAGFVLLNSRATGGADSIGFGQLGANGMVANPSSVTSAGGVGASVSKASGDFQLSTQGAGSGFAGNFASGDRVLSTATAAGGPLTIDFADAFAVTSAGSQFQTNFYGAFTARVEALSALGAVLASFTFSGNSNDANDNSAVFAGIRATEGDHFDKLRFTGLTAAGQPNNFSINQVSLSAGAAGLGLARRRFA